MSPQIKLIQGDCRQVLPTLDPESVTTVITDPPYDYEIVGQDWDDRELKRRVARASRPGSSTLVKHLPYGGGLSGGVRNARWYQKNRQNTLRYIAWCEQWARGLFRVCKPGASVLVFNSTRTVAHIQVALESAGFFARDLLVWRRPGGIPKGANISNLMARKGIPNADAWAGWHSQLRNEWEGICVMQKPIDNNYVRTLQEFGTGVVYTGTDSGGFQSNILEGFHREPVDDFNTHPTVKPVSLGKKLIQMYVPDPRSATLLDIFTGSGSFLVAAKEMGVDAVGVEIGAENIRIAERRLSQESKNED